LKSLQEPAEGAGVHLVTYIDKRATIFWNEMKEIMSEDFKEANKKVQWVESQGGQTRWDPASQDNDTKEWVDSFDRLLDLQTPEFFSSKEPVVLLPFEVLTKPLQQEFKYHFMGSRPTNSKQNVCLTLL
jgi:hypothetical protein